MKSMLIGCLFLGLVSIGLSGCDSGDNQNVLENADQSALEEYERLIEADNAAMTEADDAQTTE